MSVVRERLKNFNAMFEEVHKTQATWLVPEIQLREQFRISITEKLLPAYRSFLARYSCHLENYINYSVEDLENAVFLDFFEGRPHLRRMSHLNGTGHQGLVAQLVSNIHEVCSGYFILQNVWPDVRLAFHSKLLSSPQAFVILNIFSQDNGASNFLFLHCIRKKISWSL